MVFFHTPAPSGKFPPLDHPLYPMHMRLAHFDLDHALLDGDRDELWGSFLLDAGLPAEREWSREGARHEADYRNGLALMQAVSRPVVGPRDPAPV